MQFYFDESIRESGRFIVGALVASPRDLTPLVHQIWRSEGLDSRDYEFKSSSPKDGNGRSRRHRAQLARLLWDCRLAVVVAPIGDRDCLGQHCASLLRQLVDLGLVPGNDHEIFVDQGITIDAAEFMGLGLTAHAGQSTVDCGGIQVADHAAHILGSILLEELGHLKKEVIVGSEHGGDGSETVNLGFELWASLRYSLFGVLNSNLDPSDQLTHWRSVDGIGLLVTASCPEALSKAAKSRFGTIYLGCIH